MNEQNSPAWNIKGVMTREAFLQKVARLEGWRLPSLPTRVRQLGSHSLMSRGRGGRDG